MTTAASQQALSALNQWLVAAEQVASLQAYQAIQGPVGELAGLLESHTRPIDRMVVDALRSGQPQQVLEGLASLRRMAEADPEIQGDLVREIQPDLAGRLQTQAEALQAVRAGGNRPEFQAVTTASQTHTILGYGVQRYFLEPDDRREAANRTYQYDPTRVPGHLSMHPQTPTIPTPEEGREAYERTHEGPLSQTAQFVETQLGLQSADGRATYLAAQQRVIGEVKESQGERGEVIQAIRASGASASFATVSEAFWKRDQAIRENTFLSSRGIGPWEYDLTREAAEFAMKKQTDTVTPQDRVRYYMAEWSYLLHRIAAAYKEVEQQTDSPARRVTMAQYERDRFALEPIYMKLGRGEELHPAELAVKSRARQGYLGHLSREILRAPQTGEISRLDEAARTAYLAYAEERHREYVATARLQLESFRHDQERIAEIDGIEQAWQESRYRDLMKLAAATGRVTRRQTRHYERALAEYKAAAADYNAYAARMLQGDPKAREYTRNSKYRVLFVRLWELHNTTKGILRKVGDSRVDELQILSFAFKTQAQLIARGEKGMEGIEPLVEVTGTLNAELQRQEAGFYSLPDLYTLGGRDWGVNLLTHYARHVHVVGADQLFGYFGQAVRPETAMVEGSLTSFPDGATTVPEGKFAHRGGVLNSMHLGQFEFPATIGVPYATGLPHVSILAQEGVRMFPIAGPFIGGIERGGRAYTWSRRVPLVGKWLSRFFDRPQIHLGSGAYVQRTKDPKRRALENFVLWANVHMGNLVNLYGNGTRDIENPMPSPHADLDKHPEALHMPDYHPTRYSTGMPVTVAQETGAPVIPVAYDLGRLYAEPSMPMPSGWNWKEFWRNPSRAIKPYAGFWQPSTMFPYIRPGEDSFTIAYGDPILPESFIREEDLRQMGYGPQLDEWATLSEDKRQKNVKWLVLQLNFGIVRDAEIRAGYTATAGIYGTQRP